LQRRRGKKNGEKKGLWTPRPGEKKKSPKARAATKKRLRDENAKTQGKNLVLQAIENEAKNAL